MKIVQLIALVSLIVLSACEKKDEVKKDVVQDGIYKTEVTTQDSFRDAKKKEKVYSQVEVKEGKVVYIAFRDGKESVKKTGTYDVKRRAFMLKKEGAPKDDKHQLQNITPEGFTMQNGRKGLVMKKAQ